MAGRKPTKPWFHKASGFFCAEIAGKRHYLDKDYDLACRKLRQLRKERDRAVTAAVRDWLDAPFLELTDEFLDDVKARRAEGTYRNVRERLLRALRMIGTELRVGEIRRFHLAKIEQEMTGSYSPSTIRDTLAVVQQVFNFAVRMDLLEHSPVAGYPKPAGRGRSRLTTPNEFQLLLRHADACFRRFLLAVRLTGCRPPREDLFPDWPDAFTDNPPELAHALHAAMETASPESTRYSLHCVQLQASGSIVATDGSQMLLLCADDRRKYVWAVLTPDEAVKSSENTVQISSASGNASNSDKTNQPRQETAVTKPTQTSSNANSQSTSPGSTEELIDAAEQLKASLRNTLGKTSELIVGLKRHRKEAKIVRTTLDSLRQLQTVG